MESKEDNFRENFNMFHTQETEKGMGCPVVQKGHNILSTFNCFYVISKCITKLKVNKKLNK